MRYDNPSNWFRRSLLSVAVAAPAMVVAPPALAQVVGSLEEVVVTARRREETVQSVPVSITAFNSEQITEKGIDDVADLTNLTPGLRVVTTGGGVNADVSMRGLKRVPIGDGAPAVVIYVADIPLPYNATLVPTFDLENIQVVKGPQGTLFGRNTLGGAVLVTPTTPSFDAVKGYLKLGAGNYNARSVEGALNVPLSHTLAFRVAYQSLDRDGYVENIGVGRDLHDVNTESIRASLLWEPLDNVSNLFVADYMEGDEAGFASVPEENARFAGSLLNTIFGFTEAQVDGIIAQQKAWGSYKVNYSQAPVVDRTFWGVSNKTDWELDAFTVRNIFGYREAQSFVLQDTDGGNYTPVPVFHANSIDDSSQISNELQLLGYSGNLEWIVGAFYLKSEAEGPSGTQFSVGGPAPWNATFGTRKNEALFGQVTYDMSDWVAGLTANVGYRHTWDESEICSFNAAPVYRLQTTPGDCASSEEIERDGEEGTWQLGLDYQATQNVFVYGVARRGFREGGLNTPSLAGTILESYQAFEPEFITDFEVGVKTDWMLGGVAGRYNLAVFRSDYEDIQGLVNMQAFDAQNPQYDLPQLGYGSLNVNGGETTIEGADSELTLAFTDNLEVSWIVNYLHQSVDKQVPAPFPGTSAPEITSPTPEWSTTASVRYAVPVNALQSDLVFNLDYYWSDDYVVGVWEAESYDVANLRISMDNINNTGVGAAVFVNNAFDEEYWVAGASTTPSIGLFTANVGAPRMFGVELTYRFGGE